MAECIYFGKCGGCTSQHITYELQLENKKKVLQKAVKIDDIKVFSGKEYGYRTRMDLVFCKEGLGFRKEREPTTVIAVEECVIASAEINKLLAEVNSKFKDRDFFDFKNFTGTNKFAVIRTPPGDSSISFVLNQESVRLNEAVEQIKGFRSNANNVLVTYVPKGTNVGVSEEFAIIKGRDYLTETLLDKEFRYSIQGFFQNNHEMAEEMHRYVRKLLEDYPTKSATLLDLYSGVGTFGIINSDLFKRVVMVESYKRAVEFAKHNIQKNKVTNAEAVNLEARQIGRLRFEKHNFVIADPPRSGMEQETITQLKRLEPEAIIYISCNVGQLAKDIPKFKNYRVKSAALFDFFPQTNHSESVVELVNKKE
ncbi:MAG: 23S rRNA (uracil(1939)-C(5))-methyltransferase RlmD [Candidatus Woesearchaeota archaeon]